MTDINRHNWREHCKELQLTEDEWQQWYAVADRIRTDPSFADLVFKATETEFETERCATCWGVGWAGLAHWADASRRYKRAVVDVEEKLDEQETND